MLNKSPRSRVFRRLISLAGAAAASGLHAQTAPAPAIAPSALEPSGEEVVVLTPFEVSASSDTGYVATETLAGTRIRTELKDVASSVSVVTKEFMDDIGAKNSDSLLQYTTNAEVAGTQGNYSGVGRGTTVQNPTPITSNQRVRGLVAADQTRDFFATNIPWDSYNVDRIDIQRGPNSILFGLGSPAGIVNASTRNAIFRNSGAVETRVGSYGSVRGSLDVNQVLIDKVLSVRIDGLWDKNKYSQDPAFREDKRIYGALRFDPKLFGPDFATSFKAKFENGEIDANMPRTGTVYDTITPWFSAANKVTIDGSAISLYDLGSAAKGYSPWFKVIPGTGQQTPAFLMNGATGEVYQINSGYINNAFRSTTGAKLGSGANALGQRYSESFYGLVGTRDYAKNTLTNQYLAAMYSDTMLTDDSVFDFYNKLIDGNNKGEWAKWNTYNLSFTQGGWGDRVALELAFDHQSYRSGSWGLLGGTPTLGIDLTKVLQDGSTNANYGRAFLTSTAGGTGSSSDTVRNAMRASLFGELRMSDLTDNKFLVKLLGRHRLNVALSRDKVESEDRGCNRFAKDNAWDAYTTQSTGFTTAFDYRAPVAVLYMGKAMPGATTAAGAGLPVVADDISLRSGYTYLFDSTWTGGTNYGDAWTPPAGYLANEVFYGANNPTQASNPANYKGWSSERYLNVLSHDAGDPLYTSASKKQTIVTSYAGSLQSYLWNESIVPTFGWRYDEIKQRGVNAGKNGADKNYLKLEGSDYALPALVPANVFKGHSFAGGVVFHLNKALPKTWGDAIPLNVSLSYNDSNNFQVSARVDMWNRPIANPNGKTKEFGVLLATKDNRFSLRAIKYETKLANASVSGFDQAGFLGTLQQGLKFRNIFLYQLSNYPWSSRVGYVDTNVPLSTAGGGTFNYTNPDTGVTQTVTTGVRYFWTPAYVDANGRAVQTAYYQNYNQALPATAAHLQTWDESLAMRDASITAWNEIQQYLETSGFASTWQMDLQNASSLTTRAAYEASIEASGNLAGNTPANSAFLPTDTGKVGFVNGRAPNGFALVGDQKSEGYEFEITANVTKNWRVAFNASKATATQFNIGGSGYAEMIEFLDTKLAGAAGEMRQYNGDYQSGNSLRTKYADWRTTYTWLKAQEGTANAELRKWHFNLITNYSFTEGRLKGVNVGGVYRWMDKAIIGFPVHETADGYADYDVANPVYGPSEAGIDLWVGYERQLTEKIKWKIQFNLRNAFERDGLLPVTVQPDGKTIAAVRIKPVQEWFLTNTFSF